ncbi:MAG: isopenicillin N synthase family oxygenase [Chlamydiia bacterium]|nr:isopenicillin N synthase family oxygenase [Chlamydiia bacterium]
MQIEPLSMTHVTESRASEHTPAIFDATIPVVDMNDFFNPETRGKFVAELAQALREVGFFAVVNTGVDVAALDNAYDAARAFFALDIAEKQKIQCPHFNGQRGYVPGESAKDEKRGDFKEFLHIGRPVSSEESARMGIYPNVWPDNFELEEPMKALFQALERHMVPIQEAMAEALGEASGFFCDMTKEGDVLLRAIHYPANPPSDSIWAAQHTDIDLFTILPRATARGLQVLNDAGEWIDVVVPDNAFIINGGDMLENITNGEFRSSVHRVVDCGGNTERYSMVLFVHPRADDDLTPLPQCIARTGGVQKYAQATRWDLLEERLVDLGLASPEMIQHLGASGLMERLLDVDRASVKAMKVLRAHGVASDRVLQRLAEIE